MKLKVKYLTLITFGLLLYISGQAQNSLLDSLKTELNKSKNDSIKLLILKQLGDHCPVEDNLKYTEPIEKICLKHLARLGLKPSPKNKFYLKNLSNAFIIKCAFYNNNGNFGNAINYSLEALKIQKLLQDKNGVALCQNLIGGIYYSQGDKSKALEYWFMSLKSYELLGNKSGMAALLNNIGTVYQNQGEYDLALRNLEKGLAYQKEIKDKSGEAALLSNIGKIYKDQRNSKVSLKHFLESLKIGEEIKELSAISNAELNIAIYHHECGNISEALKYYHKSLKIEEQLNNEETVSGLFSFISQALLQQGNTKEALTFGLRSMRIAKKLGFPTTIYKSADALKKVYLNLGDHKRAFEMFELIVQVQDKLNDEQTKKSILKKEFQHQYEKKAAADSVKNQEAQKVKNALLQAQQAQLTQERTQRYALYGGLLLVIGFGGVVLNRYKITKKQKTIIESQKEQVDKAYEELHTKNKEITDSIIYARRIQSSLLTPEKYIENKLNILTRNY